MILAINIGNTNITFGMNLNEKIVSFKIPLVSINVLNFGHKIEDILNEYKLSILDITDCIIASVVPNMLPMVEEIIKASLKVTPVVINSSMDFGIDISQYDGTLVGTDRLLCCKAAYTKYKMPCVIFDLGTATTANVLDNKGKFLGGAIIPGLELGIKALNSGIALLPNVDLTSNIPLIGSNTAECIMTGAIYSLVGFIKQYIETLSTYFESGVTAVITGGNGERVMPFMKSNIIYNPNLLLEGLFAFHPMISIKN